MADTARTQQELYAIFADNNQGLISAQDIRDLVASITTTDELENLVENSIEEAISEITILTSEEVTSLTEAAITNADLVSSEEAEELIENADFVRPSKNLSDLTSSAGSRLNLGVLGLNAVRSPNYGNFIIDPSGFRVVQKGIPLGAGAASPNIDNLNHNAFPACETTETGRMIITYRRGTNHSQPNSSTGAYVVYKFSDDGGNTWTQNPIVLYGNPDGDTREGPIYRIKNGPFKGRILIIINIVGASVTEKPLVTYSDDHAETWTTPASIYDSTTFGGVLGRQKITNPPIELDDGTLLIGCYGWIYPRSTSQYVTTVHQSTDGGVTWTFRSFIDNGDYLVRQPEEPRLCIGQDGNIYVAIRYDDDKKIRFFKSTDLGFTFTNPSTPISTIDGLGRPTLIQTASGAWICITRGSNIGTPAFPHFSSIFYTSRDNCATWGLPVRLDNREYLTYVYSDAIEVAPNLLAITYAVEDTLTPNGAYAEVDFTYLLDGAGRTPLGGTVSAGSISQAYAINGWADSVPHAVNTEVATLKSTLNSLIDYLSNVGLMPPAPSSLTSCFGWWEPDNIPSTTNDITGTFTLSDNTSTVSPLTCNDTTTIAGTALSGTWGTIDNQLYCSSGAGVYVWDNSKKNMSFQSDVTYTSNATSICFRAIDANNYLFLQIGGFTMRVGKTVGGTPTNLASSGGFSPTSGVAATLKIILVDNVVTVYGVNSGGTLPTTPSITYTLTGSEITTFGTPTKFGFVATATTSRYDNISITYGLNDGDTIHQLIDKSTNALNLNQTVLANRPVYTHLVNFFKEKACLLFSGTKYLLSSSFTAKVQPNALVGVFYFTASTGSFTYPAGHGSGNQNFNISATGVYSGNAGAEMEAPAKPFPIGPDIVTVYFNGANSVLRVNGVQVASGDVSTLTWGQVRLGASLAASLFYSPGMAVFNGPLSLDDAKKAEWYFSKKYGIDLTH